MTKLVTEGARLEISGCRALVFPVSRLRRSRASALPSRNLKKNSGCSQTTIAWKSVRINQRTICLKPVHSHRFRARELWSEWTSEFPIDFNIKLVHYASLAYQMIFNLSFCRVYYGKSGNFSMSQVKFNCSIGRRRLFQEIKRHVSR